MGILKDYREEDILKMDKLDIKLEKEIYLYRFFIDEKYRGQGIGTIALSKLIEMAKEQDKDMSLEVSGYNIAKDLYERLGFKTHWTRMVLKINDNIYEN